jgi:membrane-associated phospholipid phosphatase
MVHTVWTSEWIAVVYYAYLAVACWLPPLRMRRRVAIVAIAAMAITAIGWIAQNGSVLVRQTAPMATILVGYYASGLLFVAPSPAIEGWLLGWDRRLLGDPTTRFARWPRAVLAYLEIVYLGCFVLVGAGALLLLFTGHESFIDRYWTLVVSAEFGSFAPLAFVQTRPPWAIERKAMLTDRTIHELATHAVKNFTIGANTFPSGPVAGSLAVAAGVAPALPWTGAVILVLAATIAIATVAGRYHYVIDALAGAALAVALWVIVISFGPSL